MLALSATPNLVAGYPAGLVVGFASISFMTTSTSMLQLQADPAMRGRVLALQAMVFLGSTPIGGPIVGWVCERYSPRAGLVVGGVACLVAAGWGAFAAGGNPLHRIRRTRRVVDESPALVKA